jgi:hypothetical protein
MHLVLSLIKKRKYEIIHEYYNGQHPLSEVGASGTPDVSGPASAPVS